MGRLLCIYGEYVKHDCYTYEETKQFHPHMHHLLLTGEWSTARRWERQRPTYYIIARRAESICRL
ncbi:transposase [Agathobaculum sp. LCP25S3_E8]|uniref:transposase n=1 Tax=Agathobaculum sp. LCP25S3_E8 TaxID=3438735 RepID=UPI003F91C9BA